MSTDVQFLATGKYAHIVLNHEKDVKEGVQILYRAYSVCCTSEIHCGRATPDDPERWYCSKCRSDIKDVTDEVGCSFYQLNWLDFRDTMHDQGSFSDWASWWLGAQTTVFVSW